MLLLLFGAGLAVKYERGGDGKGEAKVLANRNEE